VQEHSLSKWFPQGPLSAKAEVGELHTFDATPVLRMTAFAYNQPVR
jgi:hypothetical protein